MKGTSFIPKALFTRTQGAEVLRGLGYNVAVELEDHSSRWAFTDVKWSEMDWVKQWQREKAKNYHH